MARLDPKESYEALKDGVKEAISKTFPHVGKVNTLELEGIDIPDELSSSDYAAQKQAKLNERTFGIPVQATMVLRENATGKVLDRSVVKIATLPKITDRYSYITAGTEYQVDNQWRLRPGVYTKVKQNGDLDSFFNIKGRPLHVGFDPKTRKFDFQIGGAAPPLYPLMKALGVSDDTLERQWGTDILAANRVDTRGKPHNLQRTVIDIAQRLDPRAEVGSYEQAASVIRANLESSALHPEVTQRTLGKSIDRITPEAMLLSTGRLLGIAKGKEREDVRDSQLFKDLHSTEDFVKERITGHASVIARRVGNNLDRKGKIREIVVPDVYDRPIREFFGKVSLANSAAQTNPLRMIGGQMRTTIAGEGGVADANRITEDAKLVDPSHFGVLDPLHTPESSATGVSLQLALGARKQGNRVVVPLIDVKDGKTKLVDTSVMYDSTVALPDSVKKQGDKFVPVSGSKVVASVPGNAMLPVAMKDVDYIVPRSGQMFSMATNLVPFINSDSPNRATMAGRHMEQAIPVVNSEPPLVQSMLGSVSMDTVIGRFASTRAPLDGKVTKITADHITVADADGVEKHIPVYSHFPLNDKKGYIHSTPVVKVGDTVKSGQLLADSNFTKGGVYAPGTNLRTAYMTWAGRNFEDGVVLSETAAQKLASAHMYKKGLATRDLELPGKKKYHAYYPLQKEQLEKLDDTGVVRVGQRVKPGDTLVAALAERTLTTEEQRLKLLHNSLVKPKKDKAVTWDEDYEGEVVEVHRTPKRVQVHVKTVEPMEIGDKLCYDEQTDVLTLTGWKPVSEVTCEDLVCCLVGEEVVYQHPIAVFSYPTGGRMYVIRSQQVDLFVTAAHQMYVRLRGAQQYQLLPAESLFGKRVRYRKDGVWRGEHRQSITLPAVTVPDRRYKLGQRDTAPLTLDMSTYLLLLGAFLADGNCVCIPNSGTYGIEFSKVREPNRAELRAALTTAGISWTPASNNTKTRLHSVTLLHHFQQFGHAADKFIPDAMFGLPPEQLAVLFHWLFTWGDGHTKNGKPVSQSTVSPRLADGLQRLALHLGMAANVTVLHDAGLTTIKGQECHVQKTYDVRMVTTKLHPQVNHGHVHQQRAQTEEIVEDYDKPVYCVMVPEHVIYVRRNGKPVWSGNSGRHGNKGITTQILPDAEMPHDREGRPMEILLNPIGLAGRMNVGQILETAAGKLAEKTGQTYQVSNFTSTDNLTDVQNALKKAGISDKEDLIDPNTGKVIPQILVGKQQIIKLEHQVDKKMLSRSRDAYDHNLVPRGGGKHGAQSYGALGLYALLAHGSRANIREAQTWRSDRAQGGDTDELWGALQSGELLPPPRKTFAYRKFNAYLNTLGVNTEKDGNSLTLVPMTDKQVLEMSNGELTDAGRVLRMKSLTPEPGGLFDEKITGGLSGQKWAHLTLTHPVPNPLFEKAVMSLAGIRGPQFDSLIQGQNGVTEQGAIVGPGVQGALYGPQSIERLLSKVNVGTELERETARLPRLKGQLLNETARKVKYLRALQKANLTPVDAYMTKHVPVLPPAMRPVSVMDDGSLQTDDLNQIYKSLALVNQQAGAFPEGTPWSLKAPVAASVYDHVKSLAGLGGSLNRKHPGILDIIAGRNSPKEGYAQAVLIKRKQDLTARSTIVPDPGLALDEAALPRKLAKEMYKPFIVAELRRATGRSPLEAKELIDKDDPLAVSALDRVVQQRPVLLKRDPVLHKYGVQAFKPRLTDGRAIQIHPLVCSSYNADFDGDAQVGAVFAFLPNALYDAECGFWSQREVGMTARFQETVSYDTEGGHMVICDLKDFPHLEAKTTRGHIDYHPVPVGVKVVALDERDGPVLAEVTGWSLHRKRRVEIVTLGSGRQIVTDDDERAVYGVDASSLEWCRRRPREARDQFVPVVDQTPVSDVVQWKTWPVRSSSPRLHAQVPGNFDFGYFLGAIVGDGWAARVDGDPHDVCLGSSIAEVSKRWTDAAQVLFQEPVASCWIWRAHGKLGASEGSGSVTISCRDLARFVDDVVGHGAENKHLPPFFRTAPREFVVGLLSGLWDTDGSVSFSEAKNKPQFMCSYSSNSLQLVQEIQSLLRTWEISSTVTPTKTPKGTPAWVLGVSTVDLFKSDLELRLAHPDKATVLRRFFDGPLPDDRMAYSRNRLVPLPAALARELRVLVGCHERTSMYSTLSKAVQRQYISKVMAEDVLRVVHKCSHPLFERWRQVVQLKGVHFERVESVVTTTVEEDGYDLTVPGYETFMNVDGVVLSNTMSAFVPISAEAVSEARNMFPSSSLLSPSTGKLAFAPSHEQQVGLFMASQVNAGSVKHFTDRAALDVAFNAGKAKLNDVVTVGSVRTTLGRLRINDHLPTSMQGGRILTDLGYHLTNKEQSGLFAELVKTDPKGYAVAVNKLKDLGNHVASTEGFTFGLEDIKVHRGIRDPILHAAERQTAGLDLTKPKDLQKYVDVYGKAMTQLDTALLEQARRGSGQLDRLEVSAGIKGKAYRQLTGAPVLFVDGKGDVVPNPVRRSYSEGLTTTDYWAATSGGRKGIIQKVQSVSEPGYMTKMMTNSTIDQIVDTDDCGTERGIALSVTEPDIIGRYTTAPINMAPGKSLPAGTLLTPDLVTRIRNNRGNAKVVVRSPLRCNHATGLCARCAGLNEHGQPHDLGTNVGVLASQAIGERGTQLAMRAFHAGGVFEPGGASSLTAGGMDRALDLLYLPQKVKGSAVLAPLSGTVTQVRKDPAGGVRVAVRSGAAATEVYIPQDRAPLSTLRAGATVKRGDLLSSGPVNPHELLPLAGVNRTQGHLAEELHDLYGNYGIRRRHSELLVRAVTGVTKIEDPGDHPGFLRGDYANVAAVQQWNKQNKTGRPVQHAPVLRGVKQIPLDVQEDWLARLNHNRLQSTLVEAAQQGWSSDLHGTHPIPGIIYGEEFGKGTPDKPWRY